MATGKGWAKAESRGWMVEVTKHFNDDDKPQYTREQGAELMNFFNHYPWQAWMHLTAEPGTGFERLDKAVGNMRGRLAHFSNLQVGCWGVFTAWPQPHAHVLLLGKNRFGKTLSDVDQEVIDDVLRYWHQMMHRSAEFGLLHDVPGAIRYLIESNTIMRHSSTMLTPRGCKLLVKMKSPVSLVH